MNIINHGVWERYTPKKLPKDAPPGALFARRERDGMDWYDYVNHGTNFDPSSVKMTVVGDSVGAAVTDATQLFPAGAMVLEIYGVSTRDPQKEFGEKIYDAAQKTFRDRALPEVPDINDLLARIEALENKKGRD